MASFQRWTAGCSHWIGSGRGATRYNEGLNRVNHLWPFPQVLASDGTRSSVLDADGIGEKVYHARDARVDGRGLAVMHDA